MALTTTRLLVLDERDTIRVHFQTRSPCLGSAEDRARVGLGRKPTGRDQAKNTEHRLHELPPLPPKAYKHASGFSG
jgi:hypothetical protein